MRPCSRSRPSTKKPHQVWPIGRLMGRPRGVMTRRSTRSCLTETNTAIRWLCSITPRPPWGSALASISSNWRCSHCGNTDTPSQGYVTGQEPGTSFSYNRSYQRALHLVPMIGPKEKRHFDISYTFLADKVAVDRALQQVQSIQRGRPTAIRQKPLVDLPN